MAFLAVALYATAVAWLAGLALFWALPLLRNYASARKMGVPIRVIPIDHTNPLWLLLDRKVLPVIARLLPFTRKSSFLRYNYRGWEMRERWAPHHEMGDVFTIVTPKEVWLYLGDPDAVADMFRRGRDEFPRCTRLTEMLNVFGPNISTAEGAQWRTHRKLVATCFTEQNNEIVWSEAINLATDMIRYWSTRKPLTSVDSDARTLSLHVLSRAAFGKSFRFEGHDERKAENSSKSYKESLQTILENCILIVAFGPQTLARWKSYLPKKLARVQEACDAFQKYMTSVYEAEKAASAGASSSSRHDHNLMTSLVRASQASESKAALTEQEIYGNMFVLNFAGHDTVSHTFTFAVYFLAAHPEVQDWVADELHQVLGPGSDPADWSYTRDFPKLKRCLAVLYETLRLYTPVPTSKWTDKASPALKVGDKTVTIPPNTIVLPSYACIQTDPRYWGDDSLSWRPQRWVDINEEWVAPRKGTFVGWSDGARDCPGKKFSQVEFVAALAVMLRDWVVEPATFGRETLADARKRVLDVIEKESTMILLLQMIHPERTPLVWKRR
ncbi:cytochrome P450 [Cladorrhinum samala]|uniref:Cytochrome P450 n=1 Tax=Cladorrhinum samala TaxID=585594 RepID=A0AAV9I039_9PEZI|nr:cytochrome P450 [Cladorrhinum samala]